MTHESVPAAEPIALANATPFPISDVFPDFTISLAEADRRLKLLKEFVRDQMHDGEDYGLIPGASPKPVLFKSGAEKLNAIFGFAPLVEVSHRVEDWDKGFAAYEVKVTLINKRTGSIEAEGIGSCNSRERRYKNQDSSNVANTLLKIARKRALIDATLSATRASGLFTQDLEDSDSEGDRTGGSPGDRTPVGRRANAPRPGRTASGEARLSVVRGGDKKGLADSIASHNMEGAAPAGGLTEAQRGAILAIAGKAFGRSTKEEMAKLLDKPINQLSKSEASALIDRLRALLPEQPQHSGEPAAAVGGA